MQRPKPHFMGDATLHIPEDPTLSGLRISAVLGTRPDMQVQVTPVAVHAGHLQLLDLQWRQLLADPTHPRSSYPYFHPTREGGITRNSRKRSRTMRGLESPKYKGF